MFGVGHTPELIIIAAIVVLLFGAKNLSGLGKGLGDGIREFRKATTPNEAKKPEEPPAPDA
ncbi:MAG TPA: twin-arginine translocase TatA/TatE family subunit [Chloroflexota bacterium]|nr:twin-arginine translocase TatA/TatE family subunit [Chloroflexota bacterium]